MGTGVSQRELQCFQGSPGIASGTLEAGSLVALGSCLLLDFRQDGFLILGHQRVKKGFSGDTRHPEALV